MIRRSSRILFEVLLGLLSVLVLLGAGAAWRLSQVPVSLAFAVPYVDEQLPEWAIRTQSNLTTLS